MKRHLKRMALALFISTSCFLGTVIWFESGKEAAHDGSRAPVAKLNESTNDVQRKPLRRVIWESVSKNDDLFPGEAIRTSANAEAKIELKRSGTIVHLEPDSLVVLEENEKGLSLDFLQGNLFVQSTGKGGQDDLTLKTGSGEIKLNSADMSLSRDQTGKVNLEVHKGQAELQQGGQKVSLDKDKTAQLTDKGLTVAKETVHIVTPIAGDTVLLNLARGEKFDLTFKPLPAGYRVSADVGRSRAAMKPVGVMAPGPSGKISFTAKPGKWFVRLNAESEDAKTQPLLASALLPVTIQSKSPPSLVEPTAENPVLRENADAPTAFRWINKHNFESQVLEVSGDALFKTVKFKKNLPAQTLTVQEPLADGIYFWRVTGFLRVKDRLEGMTSAIGKFSVQSNWEVKPPFLTWPNDQHRLSYFEVQKGGVGFKWTPVAGVERFRITIERKDNKGAWQPIQSEIVGASASRWSDAKPGQYQWRVESFDPRREQAQTKASATYAFTIEDMPKIEWAEAPAEYEFSTVTPTLRAAWKPLAAPPFSYRFRVTPKGMPAAESKWQVTKQTQLDISLPNEGSYDIEVEAVDAKNQTTAQSDSKRFELKRKPLLPAPQWAQNTPPILKSDAKGNLSFGWQEVDGAKQYLMILEGEGGKVVEQKSYSRTTASVSRLKPGQYKVRLKSIDTHSRAGEASQPKELVVPSVSDIRAPKIMNMKVK